MKNFVRLLLPVVILSLNILTAGAVSMGQILGRVTEMQTGKPVALAIITFENKNDKITVTANEAGYYYSDHMPVGKYQLRTVYNGRTFYSNNVKVYADYSNEISFMVNNNDSLPLSVEIYAAEPIINATPPSDIKLSDNTYLQAPRPLGEVLNSQAGAMVLDGKLYLRGSDGVKYYIDGVPVMLAPVLKNW